MSLLLGVHCSISGGIDKSVPRAAALKCTALQIFTKNASQWRAKPIAADEAAAFRTALAASAIRSVVAHDSYLINLAAPPGETRDKSLAACADELERCALLGIPYLVMHPGAHLGDGEATGIARIAEALRTVFAAAPAEVTILLENTAGQGSYLGRSFEQLAAIMEQVPGGRFGVCFDTCHAYAAGYDIATAAGCQRVLEEFDRLIGLAHLRAFHFNDSKKGLASHVDRHEGIGSGALGTEVFRFLLTDPRFADVPKILETPKGDSDELDRVNLALLRKLAGEIA
jgi:deoxyribonuclease-4